MFTVEYAKNLKWISPNHDCFTCYVKYKEFSEEMPANIYGADPAEHIQTIWNSALNGVYGVIEEYVEEIPDPNEKPVPAAISSNYSMVSGAQTL